MSSRPFLLTFGLLVLLLLCVGGALAVSVHKAGIIEVDIHATGPGGCDLRGLKVPGALAPILIDLVPNDEFDEAREEIDEWCPLAREICRAIGRCPDFVLAEVESDGEFVKVSMEGRRLVVIIESDDEKIRIVVPIGTVEAVLKKLDS
ncbi:MAG: hypothetical protein KAY32_05615 [Candidatus Eisenbacteria sp.]|nr:hypothetical protein [Candidatus Eisenbacteria bacterium]